MRDWTVIQHFYFHFPLIFPVIQYVWEITVILRQRTCFDVLVPTPPRCQRRKTGNWIKFAVGSGRAKACAPLYRAEWYIWQDPYWYVHITCAIERRSRAVVSACLTIHGPRITYGRSTRPVTSSGPCIFSIFFSRIGVCVQCKYVHHTVVLR